MNELKVKPDVLILKRSTMVLNMLGFRSALYSLLMVLGLPPTVPVALL